MNRRAKRSDVSDASSRDSGLHRTNARATIAELSRTCAELQLILDAIPALVFYKSPDNRIVRANRAVADAFGVTPEELVGTETRQWLANGASERDELDLAAIRSGVPHLGVVEALDLPTGRRWFETSRLPQRGLDGEVIGLVVIAQDITERRQLENQLQQAQKLESIGKLAGGVAHDFNNLLTSIFGLLTVAERSLPEDSEAREYLSLIHLAAEGGSNLTKQLLAFARKQIIEPRVVDLNGLVREVSDLLRRGLGERIVLDLQLSNDVLAVRVDPSQVTQLLMNLALNARDAMREEGRLTFTTGRVPPDAPERRGLPGLGSGPLVRLTVEDTGEGFSDEAKEHLFEPFFTTKGLGQGTGLGLATCYGIVKQSDGHITVDSRPGEGARFLIYLPEANAPVEVSRKARSFNPVRAGNETLLFVEDDDLLRYLAVSALATAGYRVIEASNGEEALRAVSEHDGPIHLLVTDVIMPHMTGTELAHRFENLLPGAPILYISGYAGDALGEVQGEVLQKPFTDDELLLRVRRLLDNASSASDAATAD